VGLRASLLGARNPGPTDDLIPELTWVQAAPPIVGRGFPGLSEVEGSLAERRPSNQHK